MFGLAQPDKVATYSTVFYQVERRCPNQYIPPPPACSPDIQQGWTNVDVYEGRNFNLATFNYNFPVKLTVVDAGYKAEKVCVYSSNFPMRPSLNTNSHFPFVLAFMTVLRHHGWRANRPDARLSNQLVIVVWDYGGSSSELFESGPVEWRICHSCWRVAAQCCVQLNLDAQSDLGRVQHALLQDREVLPMIHDGSGYVIKILFSFLFRLGLGLMIILFT